MRLLILGGTEQASALAAALACDAGIDATLSLAGRTQNPDAFPVKRRIGGFGGAEGLVQYLRAERINAVIDATHPFAAQISANAATACTTAQVPLAVFSRAEWSPVNGDRWTFVPGMAGAAAALGAEPRRAFLTVGRLALGAFAAAPQHFYLIRTIEALDAGAMFAHCRHIRARAPFPIDDEVALMRAERIDCLVSKNSGGVSGRAKLAAARALGIEVIMVTRPPASGAENVSTLEAAIDWIARHRPAP